MIRDLVMCEPGSDHGVLKIWLRILPNNTQVTHPFEICGRKQGKGISVGVTDKSASQAVLDQFPGVTLRGLCAVESRALTQPEAVNVVKTLRAMIATRAALTNRNAFLEFFEPVQYYVYLLRGLGVIRRRRRQDDDELFSIGRDVVVALGLGINGPSDWKRRWLRKAEASIGSNINSHKSIHGSVVIEKLLPIR
jgi:hypothetical protein